MVSCYVMVQSRIIGMVSIPKVSPRKQKTLQTALCDAILYPSVRCDDRRPRPEHDARHARHRHYMELQRYVVRLEAVQLPQLQHRSHNRRSYHGIA